MRWLRGAFIGVLVLAVLAAGTSIFLDRKPVKAALTPRPPQAPWSTRRGVQRRTRAHPLASLVGATRVVLVIEENHEFDQVIGSRSARFLNWLATEGVLLTRYYATAHPSLPNYIALLAGDTFGIRSNCLACHLGEANLVDQLESAGISWKGYYQGLPAPCSQVSRWGRGGYDKAVDPFLFFDDIRSSPARCRRVVPLDEFGVDLAKGRLPRFAVVAPDLRDDMHSGSVARADGFLRRLYRALLASFAWRRGTRLVVTFDEGTSDRGLGGPGGGRVATVVVGPGVPAGVRDATPYDHYALLRSIERLFGLPPLRHASDPSSHLIPALAGVVGHRAPPL